MLLLSRRKREDYNNIVSFTDFCQGRSTTGGDGRNHFRRSLGELPIERNGVPEGKEIAPTRRKRLLGFCAKYFLHTGQDFSAFFLGLPRHY